MVKNKISNKKEKYIVLANSLTAINQLKMKND